MLTDLFRRSHSKDAFRTRSQNRDEELDQQLVDKVASAIEEALQKVEAQRDGLNRRLDDVIAVQPLSAATISTIPRHGTRIAPPFSPTPTARSRVDGRG